MNNSVTHSFYDTIRSFGVSISISAKLLIHRDFSKLKPIKTDRLLSAFGIIFMRRTTVRLYMDVTLASLGSVFQTEKWERKKTSDIFNSVCVYKSGLSQCSVVDQQLYFFLRASSKLSDDSLFPQNTISIPSSCNLK